MHGQDCKHEETVFCCILDGDDGGTHCHCSFNLSLSLTDQKQNKQGKVGQSFVKIYKRHTGDSLHFTAWMQVHIEEFNISACVNL